MKLLTDFVSLIYPHLCLACGKALYDSEKTICTYCRYELPRTGYHLEQDNRLSRLFWGKVPIQAATAAYHFDKGGKVQKLIHQLKYRGKTDVGLVLGRSLGQTLQSSPVYQTVTSVIPVPLHPKKERQRGYNQSDFIAQGVAESLGVANLSGTLMRSGNTSSQTKKSLFDRWQNVHAMFAVANEEELRNQHVLLVDDVITTGSTLEACASRLLRIEGVKVSVATLACA